MNGRLVQLILAAALPAGCSKPVEDEAMSLHPDFPVVEGNYQMTREWAVNLPGRFNRRIEDGDLVIWRPGFTIWTTVWNNDREETPEERLDWLRDGTSPDAYAQETENEGQLVRYAYRLDEESEDKSQAAFYCFANGQNGHVQMAIYFDSEDDLPTAKQIWRSLAENHE
jgi:hypothetical protein